MHSKKRIIWSIAGSDSGGGAGIQADLLTIRDFGFHGCTAITANTAQNTVEVASINAVPAAALTTQLEALQRDLPPDAIKIGLLANAEQVSAVVNFLRQQWWDKYVPVVYDPVAVATSGSPLTEGDVDAAILETLFSKCDLITPNLQELEWLAGAPVRTPADVVDAAQKLHASAGCCAVLVTGGHSEFRSGEIADYLWDGEQGDWFIGKKVESSNNHGTGCTLSSAIACCMAMGYPLRDACIVGKAYVQQALPRGEGYQGVGSGPGPLGHCGWPDYLYCYPEVLVPGEERAAAYGCQDGVTDFVEGFPALGTSELGLYPVVDSVEWVRRLAEEGVGTIQLRIKQPGETVREDIQRAVAIAGKYALRLFINDHWELAIECGAYGVHLGQEDLRTADLAAIKAAGLKLGISTHGFYELLKAYRYKPSYLAIGAIYPTGTKDMSGQIQGAEKLRRMVSLLHNYPLVAIGGINAERSSEVYSTGVGSIAVVSAITRAADYRAAVRQLQSERSTASW